MESISAGVESVALPRLLPEVQHPTGVGVVFDKCIVRAGPCDVFQCGLAERFYSLGIPCSRAGPIKQIDARLISVSLT